MAEPALPLREGEGSSAVGNGEGYCLSWLFLMNGQKNPTPTMRHKSHSLRQPLPKWCCSSERCCLLRRQIFGLATHQRLPPGDYPSRSTAIVLQNARVPSEDASSGSRGLVYYRRIAFCWSRAQGRKSNWFWEHFEVLQCFLSL